MTTGVQAGQRAVTRVRAEQIDSQPLSTLSRQAASIIIRRQQHFEASWSSSGPMEQAGGHVTRLLQLATTTTTTTTTRSPDKENAPPAQACRQPTDQTTCLLPLM